MNPRSRLASCLGLLLVGCADDGPEAPDAATGRGAADVQGDVAPDVSDLPGLARALTITDVSLFQVVRVPLLQEGAIVTERMAPVVAGRGAVVRVYVRPEAGYRARSIDGELRVRGTGAETVVRSRRSIERVSRDGDPTTVFDFQVPAEAVGPDTRISVRLVEPGGAEVERGTDDPARFPADGSEHAVPAQDDGGGLDVVLVPLRWDADGSGRLPDTSPEQIERMRSLLRAMYPVREVRISVHEPVAWSRGLLPSGSADFGAVLSSLRALRTREAPPADQYYYGMVAPTEYFDEYCRGPCTLGQGYLSLGADDPRGKVAAGLGFDGDRAAGTLAHELGHNHGRAHAPCGGAAGPDPAFPYRGGAVGGWGYDERRRVFVRPSAYDFMGYCEPRWISDYNYAALWERILDVHGVTSARAARTVLVDGTHLRHRVLRYGGDVEAGWLDALEIRAAAGGSAALRWLDATGLTLRRAVAQADLLGDSDEVHVLVPPAPPGALSLEVTYGGQSRRVSLPPVW